METAVFEKLGLEKAEAQAYLALLKCGLSSATAISRETKIERTRVYRIIEKLIDKGLASFIVENKVRKFRAIEPERLLLELKEKERELKSYLPELKELGRMKRREPKIEIYRGENGVRSLSRSLLSFRKNYDVIAGKGVPGMQEFFELFMEALEEAGIHERVLAMEGMDIAKSKNTEVRYLPKNHEYESTIGVCGSKVGIILWSKPFLAIAIEDQSLGKTFRSYFELLWNNVARKGPPQ